MTKIFLNKTVKSILRQKGSVMPFVLAVMALILLSALFIITAIQRDAMFVQRIRLNEQARAVAEAGLNDAFGRIKTSGFAAATNFSGNLDSGSYSVTFSTTGGRTLVTSAGTVSGTTVDVSAEIRDNTPTALNYFSGAGNDILFKIHTNVDGSITGDIHANNNVYLYCQPFASLRIDGDASASGIVQEGNQHYSNDNKDDDLYINGINNDGATIYELAPRITFPEFDYPKYKADAEAAGNYYDTSRTYNNTALNPGNGIIYVDGDVTFTGTCTLTGGIMADNINISGTLEQRRSTDCDLIVAKSGDVVISGRLLVEHGIVYASQDIYTHEKWGPEVSINGIMLARRNIEMWNFRTEIDYHHIYMVPTHMTEESSGFSVISYND